MVGLRRRAEKRWRALKRLLAGKPPSPERLAGVFAAAVVVLVGLSFFGQVLRSIFDARLLGIPALFDVKMEANVPTLYSSLALLVCAFLAARITAGERPGGQALRWGFLAFVFFYLAADEAFRLHERLGSPLGRATLEAFGFGPETLFQRSWVIFGGVLALVVALVCWRLLAGLPPRIRWMLVGAGLLYLVGALGMEVLYGRFEFLYGRRETSALLVIITTVEEFLEMTAVVVAIYALASYLDLRRRRRT